MLELMKIYIYYIIQVPFNHIRFSESASKDYLLCFSYEKKKRKFFNSSQIHPHRFQQQLSQIKNNKTNKFFRHPKYNECTF